MGKTDRRVILPTCGNVFPMKKQEVVVGMSNAIKRLRVVATLVIVAYHCVCPYLNFNWGGNLFDIVLLNKILQIIFIDVLCFTMLPTFFMLSGMLFYSRKEHYADRLKTLRKKFDRLLVPYALILMFCSFVPIPQIGIAGCWGHLWFVKNLFIYFCIALLMFRVKEVYVFALSFICFIVYCMQSHLGIVIDGEIGRLMQYAVYFYGGYLAARYFHWIRNCQYFRYGVLLAWLVALAIRQQTLFTLLFNVVLLAFVPMTVVTNKAMLYLDKQSFRIYLIHHVLMFALFASPCFQWLYARYAIAAMVLMFVVLLAVTLVICGLLTKMKFRYF